MHTGTYTVNVEIIPKDFGRVRVPILFTFTRGDSQKMIILREIVYKCVINPEILQVIQPVAPYTKPEVVEALELEIVTSDLKPNIEYVRKAL